MNKAERDLIKKIDDLILSSTDIELKKIQEIDKKTQLDGISFYDSYVNLSGFTKQKIKPNYHSVD